MRHPDGTDVFTVGLGHAHFADVQSAITAIGTPATPVILKVGPGTFPAFTGAPNIFVVGSGVGVTIFEDTTSPVVHINGGALTHASVRYFDSAPATGVTVAGNGTLEHVFVDVAPGITSSGSCEGIRSTAGPNDVTLRDVGISVFSGNCTSTIGVEGFSGVNPTVFNMQRVEIFGEDQAMLLNGGSVTCAECVVSVDASNAVAIELGGGSAHIIRSKVVVTGNANAIAIELDNVADFVEIEHSVFDAQGGTSGIGLQALNGSMRLTYSTFHGTLAGIEYDAGMIDGTLYWSEANGGLGDIPPQCRFVTDPAGGDPCG